MSHPMILDRLDSLDDRYARTIDQALLRGDHDTAEALAAAYDKQIARLAALCEDDKQLTPLRRLALRLTTPRAA